MSEENTTETFQSPVTAIVIREKPAFLKDLAENTAMMNSLIKDIQQIDSNYSEYEKSIAYGHYLTEIRKQIIGKPLDIIRSLMNTGIGFKTDRNPNDPKNKQAPYDDEIVKNCVVQAIMHGLRIHGNEFNILGGNFYATKEGLERIVNTNPLLEREIKEKIKQMKQSSDTGTWAITYEYEFKLKECAEVKGEVTFYIKGKMGNYEIPLDAIQGKAKRKLYKVIYNKMTQGFKLEDADDIDDIDLPGQLKDTGAKSKLSQLGKDSNKEKLS